MIYFWKVDEPYGVFSQWYKSDFIDCCGIKFNYAEQFRMYHKDNLFEDKEIENIKVLYITTAIDGEDDSDTSWIAEEFKTILDLGIKKENIKEYKMDHEIDLSLYDMIYMMGGNTFYLLKKIRDTKFDIKLNEAINNGIVSLKLNCLIKLTASFFFISST